MLELLALCRIASAHSHYTYLFEVSLFNKMNACNLISNASPYEAMDDVGDRLTMAIPDKSATADQPTEPTGIKDHIKAVLVTTIF